MAQLLGRDVGPAQSARRRGGARREQGVGWRGRERRVNETRGLGECERLLEQLVRHRGREHRLDGHAAAASRIEEKEELAHGCDLVKWKELLAQLAQRRQGRDESCATQEKARFQ